MENTVLLPSFLLLLHLVFLFLPQPVLENPEYKLMDLGGTSWKMTNLNTRLLALLATIIP